MLMIVSGALCTMQVSAVQEKQEGILAPNDNTMPLISGLNGDVKWTLRPDGILSFDRGTFKNSITADLRRMNRDYPFCVKKIVFTAPVSTESSLFLFTSLPLEDIEGLEHLDTSRQETMDLMFSGLSKLKRLDLRSFNTSGAHSMRGMFAEGLLSTPPGLEYLDLSSFDMRQGVDTTSMFEGASCLKVLTLGKNFRFDGWSKASTNIGLPEIKKTAAYTGYWQDLGDGGTLNNPKGKHVFTSDQLMKCYDGKTMAGTFVWQPTRGLSIDLKEKTNGKSNCTIS
ncbi:BspA family leucine-rich repeat surface protein [Lactococcus garvieae]|uniref:BspA family leucine-rich repeat surface protein n=1 Tax=Lactococcus garvieae TaxID=1363 RepID=UPI0038553E67